MLKIKILADTPEEAATFFRLIASSTPSSAASNLKIVEIPSKTVKAPAAIVKSPPESPESPPTTAKRPSKPPESPAETPATETPATETPATETTVMPDDSHWPSVVRENLAFTTLILRVYDRNPRCNSKALFRQFKPLPWTQAAIRALRTDLVTLGLLKTKGTKSPFYVTKRGYDFLADEVLVPQAEAEIAEIPGASGVAPTSDPVEASEVEAPGADDLFETAEPTVSSAPEPPTIETMSTRIREVMARAGTVGGGALKTETVTKIKTLLKTFKSATVALVPEAKRHAFMAEIEGFALDIG